jgi:hypothetical protein
MTPEGLKQLKVLYARELGTLGFKEVASGAHGWHVDAIFSNGRGGMFGFRLEAGSPGDNPHAHHIVVQANAKVPLAGEVQMDYWPGNPGEGINYFRGLFVVTPGSYQYKPLPTQAPSQHRPAPGQQRQAPVQAPAPVQKPAPAPAPLKPFGPVQLGPDAKKPGPAPKSNSGRFQKKK